MGYSHAFSELKAKTDYGHYVLLMLLEHKIEKSSLHSAWWVIMITGGNGLLLHGGGKKIMSGLKGPTVVPLAQQ